MIIEFVRTLRFMDELRKIDPQMHIQTACVFMMVANEEGIRIKDLKERLGFSQSSAARNVALLVDRSDGEGGHLGHGLIVASEDPVERRRKILRLTAKGRRVAETIKVLMNSN